MPATISCVSLPVDDLQRSARFYRDCLGMTVDVAENADHIPIPLRGGHYLVLILKAEFAEFSTMVHQSLAAPGSTSCILSYFAATIEEVDDILARCADSGGNLGSQAIDRAWGYSGYVTDPDGHIWEIMYNANFAQGT